MSIKEEHPNRDYTFHNPHDTKIILFGEISKKGEWRFNRKKNREEKIDWWYECKHDFIKNVNLLFGKFIPINLVRYEESNNKDKYLQLVIKEFENAKNKWSNFTFLKNRHEELIRCLGDMGFNHKKICAKCTWRLVIGLGATHPQETSMTLHHIYGFPYIPGSAVKGITRHWAVLKFSYNTKEANQKIENIISRVSSALERGENLEIEVDGIKFQELIEIFGTQKQAGKVIFMDAYPEEDINLKIDIINVHYPEYYSGSKPPADWQNPRPVKFLTVEKTSFSFTLLSRDTHLLSNAQKLLKEALKHHGIGAKTSLGYGLFFT
ncbi:MAG: type III-B CRISPR module RAMP protein Cmr6 [Thermodesulfovibrio sp.]|nr:type III-B CRISPR module RAMP protein Cmr6 [Thermodesulfovibrio sp.]MDW7998074.1 type III-B CRISPR module RAMP protein Cmr6 [Thermodesulfovibrio sp.]